MAAGKSAVGRRLAAETGRTFIDADDEIERATGRSVQELFEDGETHFREIEREVVGACLRRDRVVIATGGGWSARPEWVDEVPEGFCTVWLDVSLEGALARASGDATVRPLLTGPEGREVAANRYEERRPSYALAEVRVDTEGSTVDDVSARILEILAANRDEPRTE
ncbi:MAG: shikimate kinase [Gemmatimonadota bacterium]